MISYAPTTLGMAVQELAFRPGDLLVRRWNWKASLFSSLFRGVIFLCVNLTAGWHAALGAMSVEFAYRACTAGFYGALTQAFRRVHPAWQASLAVSILLPTLSHSIELLIHWLRGTPNLTASITASVIFTALSTSFNLYAMRRGLLVVGDEGRPLAEDMRALPAALCGFFLLLPRALRQRVGTLPK